MEREGAIALLPATLFGDAQVRGPKKVHSQCRGRGFESHHLHESPGQRAKSGLPTKSHGAPERYCDFVEVPHSGTRHIA